MKICCGKQCPAKGQPQPLDNFYRKRKGQEAREGYCIICKKANKKRLDFESVDRTLFQPPPTDPMEAMLFELDLNQKADVKQTKRILKHRAKRIAFMSNLATRPKIEVPKRAVYHPEPIGHYGSERSAFLTAYQRQIFRMAWTTER